MSSVDGGPTQEERQGLEEQRRFLLDSLRDLERERDAGDISESDYNSLRDDYTARAAAVLRALEPVEGASSPEARLDEEQGEVEGESEGAHQDDRAGEHDGAPGDAPSDGAPGDGAPGDGAPGDGDDAASPANLDEARRRPTRRRAMATVAVILLIAVASGVGVALFSGERVSGPALTDGTPAERLVRAHQRDSAGKAADAVKLYDSVLKDQPANVEALTYKGWLLARAGLGDLALASLDKAIAIDPKYPDPHFFRGVVLYRDRGDPAAAIPEFETFLGDNPPPDAVAAVQSVLDQARQDLAQKNAAPATTAPAPQAPPGEGG